MMIRREWWLLAAWLVALGCQRAEDPAIIQQRGRYLLPDEPKGALGVTAARAQVSGQTQSPQPLVLVGRVGAGPQPTWDPGKAAFVICDTTAKPPAHAHAAGHDHDSCPFCQADKKNALDATALVRVVDERGNVVGIDARQLFSLVDGQTVVVRGQASIDALGHLVVVADGVYVRR
jgi:hypothetical protein